MNIQILGRKNCNNTKKAERFFKERRINFHFRDLSEKGLSKGELENITRAIEIDDLIDKESKQYKKRGLEYMVYNSEEEILSDSLIIKTPIVRNGNMATISVDIDTWSEWIEAK
ncbi:MAG: ArsC family transcriptional regulator [Bacteroidota bacterium]